MKKKTMLSLKTLAEADENELAFEFDSCLRIIESDIRQRPEVENARKVTLTVTMKPGEDPKTAIMSVSVVPSVPKRGPSARVLKVSANGMEMGDDRENPDQTTIESFTPTWAEQADAEVAERRARKNAKDRERRAAKKAQVNL